MVQHTQLNHEAEKLYDVFNMSEDDAMRIKYAIAFETIKGALMEEELYPDASEDEIPRNLTTRSGCLERCYIHVSTEAQKEMLLLTFMQNYEKWDKGYHLYKATRKKMDKMNAEIGVIMNGKMMDDAEIAGKKAIVEMVFARIKKETIGIEYIVNAIRQSKYHLDRFINIYEETLQKEGINDMISKSMRGEEPDHDDSDDDGDDHNPFGGLF